MDTNNVYLPTATGGTVGTLSGEQKPRGVCPGCGRCHVCGHPTPQPYYPIYQVPYMPNYSYLPALQGGVAGTPNSGTIAVNMIDKN